jgi:peptidyl-prolyl cis-trans isomerase D
VTAEEIGDGTAGVVVADARGERRGKLLRGCAYPWIAVRMLGQPDLQSPGAYSDKASITVKRDGGQPHPSVAFAVSLVYRPRLEFIPVLKFLRKNKRATWIRGTFAAIVLVFIFWGIGAGVGMMGERGDFAARVNDEEIDALRVARTYANMERMYRQIYKENLPPDLFKTLDLRSKAVDQLIRIALLRQEAERIGLQVGDAELAASIQGIPQFQSGGLFTKENYLATLRANQIPVGEFEDAQREELLVRKLDDVIGAGVHVTDAELREQFHLENDKVNLDFVRVKAADFADQVQPSDTDLQTYFDAHQEEFRIPERVRIEFLAYRPTHFQEQVPVSDTDVQDYYDLHRDEFAKPEEVQARHILFELSESAADDEKAKVRAQAQEVLAKAKAGEDFAALATQHSQDPGSKDKGGDLGFFTRGQMVPPFEEAAFTLEPGAISDLVESTFGLHIIKVEAKHAAETPTVEQVRPQIVDAIKQARAKDVAAERAGADRDQVVTGKATLESAGQAAGIAVEKPEPFARTELIAGIGREMKVIDAAFAASPDTVADVIETPTAFYVVRVVEKLPSRIPELGEARDDVVKAYRKQQSEALAKKKAEDLLEPLKQQGNLAAFASANQLTVEETGGFTRPGNFIPKLGTQPDLKTEAFKLAQEHPIAPAVYNANGDAVLIALKAIEPADDSQFAQQKDTLRQQAVERRKSAVSEQFLNELKKQARIEINPDVVASIGEGGTVPRSRR